MTAACIDIGEIVLGLARRIEALARDILPGGAKRGAEWVVASGNTAVGQGALSVDASYVYVCTAANTVKRAALSAF